MVGWHCSDIQYLMDWLQEERQDRIILVCSDGSKLRSLDACCQINLYLSFLRNAALYDFLHCLRDSTCERKQSEIKFEAAHLWVSYRCILVVFNVLSHSIGYGCKSHVC